MNYTPKKKYICSLCGKERKGNVDGREEIICWLCVQKLLNTSREKRQMMYEILVEKGFEQKAMLIDKHFPKEENQNEKAKKSKRNYVRKTLSRVARPTINRNNRE